MTNRDHIQREIHAAEAERVRKAMEQAPARRLAAAQQQLAELERQQWIDDINMQSKPYHDAVARMRATWREIAEALDRLDLAAAQPKIQPLYADFDLAVKTVQVVNDAVRAKHDPIWRAAYLANGGDVVDAGNAHGMDEVDRAKKAGDDAIRGLLGMTLPTPDDRQSPIPSPIAGLVEWVDAIPAGYERQRRRGLCYALVGWFCDPQMDSMFNGRLVTRYRP